MSRTVLAVVVLLAGCPDQMRPGKRTAVEDQLDRISAAANAYAAKHGAYLAGASALLPANNGSGAGCCGGTGSGSSMDHKCPVSAEFETDPIWKQLGVRIDEPSLYRYRYESTDASSYVVTAEGDLDCNGKPATWTLKGNYEPGKDGKPSKGMTMIVRPRKGEY